MPAEKTTRVQERRRIVNRRVRSATRTSVTAAQRLIKQGESGPAAEAVVRAVSLLDRAARKGVIHPNNAARRKSLLMRRLNQPQPVAEKAPARRAARSKSGAAGKPAARPKAGAKLRKSPRSA